MDLTLWRITKAEYAAEAYRGEGAQRYGGRWGSPGRPLIYTAGSLSLAVLEFMANLDTYDPALLEHYVVVPASVEAELAEEVSVAQLPSDWRAVPHPPSTRAIGDRWMEQRTSLVLSVPSAVLPVERNYLINPVHTAFERLRIRASEPLDLDPRVLRSEG